MRPRSKPLVAPLPGRDGVAPSRVWLPDGPWHYMGEFLLQRFAHVDAQALEQRLTAGDIVTDQGQPVHFYTPYRGQQWLWYYRQVKDEVPVPFELKILYADDYLIAVDKPHFLPTIPSGAYLKHTVVARLRRHFDNYDLSPLHRLDRETAGVLLFCVQPRYRGAYQALFQSQDMQKEYEAIAPLPPSVDFPLQLQTRIESVPGKMLMHNVQGTPNSDTYIHLLHRFRRMEPDADNTGSNGGSDGSDGWAGSAGSSDGIDEAHDGTDGAHDGINGAHDGWYGHFLLQPLTGRKHQLRVHMQALGAPIVNDSLYPSGQPMRAADDFRAPLQLLSRSLSFIDPVTREFRVFRSQRRLALLPDLY